jgi:SAM-dependent methyltransferase
VTATPVAERTSPQERIWDINAGFWKSRALYAAARMGIADLIARGVDTVPALAATLEADPRSLFRLLRFLCSFGIFVQRDDGRFALTELGALLRDGVPGSMRALVTFQNGDPLYAAWGDIVRSIRAGDEAFTHVHGMNLFAYNVQHPEENDIFNAAMVSSSGTFLDDLAERYPFGSASSVADVGGGIGRTLVALLKRHPHLRGVVYDTPAVYEAARRYVEAEGLQDRCEVRSGDFFKSVPEGFDLYLMSRIIHDWDDERAAAILRTCHRAMGETSRLLILERVIPPPNQPSAATATDMLMMVVMGGQERTQAEYQALLDAAGLQLLSTIPIASEMRIVEVGRA